jgi:predicted transposase/invertase (TIGR01784 family)
LKHARLRSCVIIEIETLELVKLPKGDEHNALLDWLRLMNAKEEKEMAELAERNPAIGKVTAVIKQMSEDERERALAEEREKARRIRKGQLAYARNEGLRIGEKRGEQKGTLNVARNLKRQQVDTDVIAAATGLSAAEIETL